VSQSTNIYRESTVQAMNRTISKKIVRPKKYSEKVVDEIYHFIELGLIVAMNIPRIQDRKETVLKLYLSGGA